jgi:hypothetical protein
MKLFDWNEEKNAELKRTRNTTFKDVLFYIKKSDILEIVEKPITLII